MRGRLEGRREPDRFTRLARAITAPHLPVVFEVGEHHSFAVIDANTATVQSTHEARAIPNT